MIFVHHCLSLYMFNYVTRKDILFPFSYAQKFESYSSFQNHVDTPEHLGTLGVLWALIVEPGKRP